MGPINYQPIVNKGGDSNHFQGAVKEKDSSRESQENKSDLIFTGDQNRKDTSFTAVAAVVVAVAVIV